jgi:hypothetical protein
MRETSVDSQRLLGKAMPGFARVIVEVDFHGLPLRPQPSRARGLLQAVSLAFAARPSASRRDCSALPSSASTQRRKTAR